MKYKLKSLGRQSKFPLPEESEFSYGKAWKVIDSTNESREIESPLWEIGTCQYQFFTKRFYAENLDKALEEVAEILEDLG